MFGVTFLWTITVPLGGAFTGAEWTIFQLDDPLWVYVPSSSSLRTSLIEWGPVSTVGPPHCLLLEHVIKLS